MGIIDLGDGIFFTILEFLFYPVYLVLWFITAIYIAMVP